MYGRAPRVLHPEQKSTVNHVGPGTYDHHVKTTGLSLAPFNSMSKRETFLDVPDQVMLAPGPGHYSNADVKIGESRNLAGHSTMASRTKRFESSSTFTPGPGAYSVKVDITGRPLLSTNASAMTAAVVGQPAVAALSKSQTTADIRQAVRPRYKRHTTAPSIPTTTQAYGYEETHAGGLEPQNAPKRDSTLGPAYYTVRHDESEPTKKYHGAHFGNRTSRRFQNKVANAENPPPGQYDTTTTTNRPATAAAKEQSRPAPDAQIPRYHQIIEKVETKKNVPGPGAYNIAGSLGRKATSDVEPLCTVPFGTQSRRFVPGKNQGPPVGLYNDPRTALQKVQKVTGAKKNPFGQTTARFKVDRPQKLPPAPTAYNVDHTSSIVDSCIRKAGVGRYGVFGTLSHRETDMKDKEKTDRPGPAHYQRDDNMDTATHGGAVQTTSYPTKKRTAQFASQSNRLDRLELRGLEAPPPGTYDVAPSYEAVHGKRTHAKPSTVEAVARQMSFLTGQARFSHPTAANGQVDPNNPEPGRYYTEFHKATGVENKRGLLVSTTERFDEPSNLNPGPGAYEFHPSHAHTVLKGTHNATLNNPLYAKAEDVVQRPTKAKFVVGPV